MPKFDKLNTPEGLDALNKYLVDYSYVEGYVLSAADFESHANAGSAPDSKKYPNAARWYNHISSYSTEERKVFGVGAAAPAATPAAAPAKGGDDDFDLWEETAEDEAHAAEMERKAQEALKKKAASGKVVVGKSTVVLDVKPWDDTTDMVKLEENVRSIIREGLTWGKGQLVEVGYGIKKLQISAVVVDELVSVDEISERIQEFEDFVQSVDVAAFNKL
eukprot:TRINITY_DN3067_c0_g1_i1.p1 TRINITY_DN3067_c0_g1~~TRINITY_DN3067_c0_g1_i1.p1  ORF type:complete len:219 (+),score=76.64 TRINITY_DN3067_c0_g1_i1:109-765(+)